MNDAIWNRYELEKKMVPFRNKSHPLRANQIACIASDFKLATWSIKY